MTVFDGVRIDKKTCRKKTETPSRWRRPTSRRPVAGNDRYVAMADILKRVFIGCGIPEYLHPKSNRIYSQHQRIAMLVLGEFIDKSQREFCRTLPSYRGFCDAIGITNVPHHTAVCKFAKLVDRGTLLKVIGYFGLLCRPGIIVAMDGTGLSNFDRSGHYEKRLKDFGNNAPRTFTKASIAIDTDTLLVLACEVSEGNVHDVRHVGSLLYQLSANVRDVEYVVADKGYDSETVHRAVRDTLGAKAVIPARENTPKRGASVYRTAGKCRSEMKRRLVKCSTLQRIYQLRALVECVNSMFKRTEGSFMRAKLMVSRVNRTLCKMIAHNLRRVFDLGMVRTMMEL